ncbi:MAG: ABC transporter ATP-binding protein, partial [Chloroflexi bacterium]|nr:ABC transporter ATP-binding protein [Chloroflexota bacterium]
MAAEFSVASPIRTNHSSPIRFIFSHVARHPIAALALMFGAFCNAFLAGVVPGAVGSAFDALLLQNDTSLELARNSVLLVIGSQTLRSLLQFIRNFSAEVFAQRFE